MHTQRARRRGLASGRASLAAAVAAFAAAAAASTAAPAAPPAASAASTASTAATTPAAPARTAPAPSAAALPAISDIAELSTAFAREVDRRLELPASEQEAYAGWLAQALAAAGVAVERAQLLVLVDRSEHVQAAMVWWLPVQGPARLVGAAPASTGRPSGFEHFETPLGVFDHSIDNPDFRAEGTRNAQGICGYGAKGMRVFDFGWVRARRAWAPGEQEMRLQLHATDPRQLEPRLGQRASKGCIRIPATLNTFLDRRGVLDAAYEEAMAAGRRFWVLRADRQPTPWPGRLLVVVDSQRAARPDWAVPPRAAR